MVVERGVHVGCAGEGVGEGDVHVGCGGEWGGGEGVCTWGVG